MPQPALHLLLGSRKLARWSASGTAPFDIGDPAAVNAFLHGTLAPDLGNFPGGSRELGRAVHTRRTADVVRALFDGARTPAETAFAWGWLSHVLADAAIHPLINRSAARHSPAGDATLVEHVRVEVGVDVWFCCDAAELDRIRLRPAFRSDYAFLRDVLNDHLPLELTPARVSQMERMLILFSHAAVRFARGAARRLCWGHAGPRPSVTAALVWHTATRLSREESVVHAYLRPRIPDSGSVRAIERAIIRVFDDFADCERNGVADLPSWNLEDGTLEEAARSVA